MVTFSVSPLFQALTAALARQLPDGPPVVGCALVGPAVVGPAVVGPAVVGPAVVGPAVVGRAVVGPAVVGPAVVGRAVVGGGVDVLRTFRPRNEIAYASMPVCGSVWPVFAMLTPSMVAWVPVLP